MENVTSIVIVKHGESGYSATIRFKNKLNDRIVSSNNHNSIYREIEYAIRQVAGGRI